MQMSKNPTEMENPVNTFKGNFTFLYEEHNLLLKYIAIIIVRAAFSSLKTANLSELFLKSHKTLHKLLV